MRSERGSRPGSMGMTDATSHTTQIPPRPGPSTIRNKQRRVDHCLNLSRLHTWQPPARSEGGGFNVRSISGSPKIAITAAKADTLADAPMAMLAMTRLAPTAARYGEVRVLLYNVCPPSPSRAFNAPDSSRCRYCLTTRTTMSRPRRSWSPVFWPLRPAVTSSVTSQAPTAIVKGQVKSE